MAQEKKEKISFKSWNCFLKLGHYGANGRLAIQLLSDEENADKGVYYGEPITVATVNIPEVPLKENEVIIKDYSENKGILETLQKNGLITDTKREISIGFVTVHVVEKTAKLLDLEKEIKTAKPKMKK